MLHVGTVNLTYNLFLDKTNLSMFEASAPLFEKISADNAEKLRQFVFGLPVNTIDAIGTTLLTTKYSSLTVYI